MRDAGSSPPPGHHSDRPTRMRLRTVAKGARKSRLKSIALGMPIKISGLYRADTAQEVLVAHPRINENDHSPQLEKSKSQADELHGRPHHQHHPIALSHPLDVQRRSETVAVVPQLGKGPLAPLLSLKSNQSRSGHPWLQPSAGRLWLYYNPPSLSPQGAVAGNARSTAG